MSIAVPVCFRQENSHRLALRTTPGCRKAPFGRSRSLEAMSNKVPTVTVCRGCCCGTHKKHPDVDHDAQLDLLRESVGDSARVRNQRLPRRLQAIQRHRGVAVPCRTRRGRSTGVAQKVLTVSAMRDIGEWLHAGGPGAATPPPAVEHLVYRPWVVKEGKKKKV